MHDTQKKRFLDISRITLLGFLILFVGLIGCSDMMGNSQNESNSGGASIFNTTANTANRSLVNAPKTSSDFSGTWMGFKDDGIGTYSLVQSGSSLSGNGFFNEIGSGNGSYSITGTVVGTIATIAIAGTSSNCSLLNTSGTFAISSTQSSLNVSISGTDCKGNPLQSSFNSLKTSSSAGDNSNLSGTWRGFKEDNSATYTIDQSGSSITGNGTFSQSELGSGLFSLAGTVNGTSATVSVTGVSSNCSPLKALGTFTLNATNKTLSVSLSGTDCYGNPLTSSFSSAKVS